MVPEIRKGKSGNGALGRLETVEKQLENYPQIWTGFYKKSIPERLNLLQKLEPDLKTDIFSDGGLEVSRANLMVENCIGKLSLPLGLGLNFVINGKHYKIPMCIEEPSVIAACSSAAKFIYDSSEGVATESPSGTINSHPVNGKINSNQRGFTTYSTEPIMMGQIQVVECWDFVEMRYLIEKHKRQIISKANEYCLEMVKRGGGVVDV